MQSAAKRGQFVAGSVLAGLLAIMALGQQTIARPAPAPAWSIGFPLKCADKACKRRYEQGAYTAAMINSVLDHSLRQNPNSAWQYGSLSSKGGDGVVVAWNGSRADGGVSASDEVCVKGAALLGDLMAPSPCGPGYVSYDEHPGYDYRAELGVPVYAAAAGTVVSNGGQRCIMTNISVSCDAWGFAGIDHGNGYVSQYGHLSEIVVKAGEPVSAGTLIGYVGKTAPVKLAPHLHFEVMKHVGSAYLVVDPYGWTGKGKDPLYSAGQAAPMRLWAGVPQPVAASTGAVQGPIQPAPAASPPTLGPTAAYAGRFDFELTYCDQKMSKLREIEVVARTLGDERRLRDPKFANALLDAAGYEAARICPTDKRVLMNGTWHNIGSTCCLSNIIVKIFGLRSKDERRERVGLPYILRARSYNNDKLDWHEYEYRPERIR